MWWVKHMGGTVSYLLLPDVRTDALHVLAAVDVNADLPLR